jgi:ABC-type branched-subunit amino acid transport system ATPase component
VSGGTAIDEEAARALLVDGVRRAFEGIEVLREVSLTLRGGEVVGLIGPNGAGKTTLVNLVTGFYPPNEGRIVLDGQEVTGWRPHRRARCGLARTFQHGQLYGALSVRENVEVSALGVGMSVAEARRRADHLLDIMDLSDHGARPASALPHGLERKLAMARALATAPRYLLLDEPAAGLSDAEVPAFADAIREVRDQGTGILLIEHNMALIFDVCDRIVVLDQGAVIAEGDAEQIHSHPEVVRAYLGLAADGDGDQEWRT